MLGKKAGLATGEFGGITVNKYLQTSDKNIYAIGDCTESINFVTGHNEYLPLGSTSTKMGRIAADNISGRKMAFKGFISSAMFKVFDVNVARTGLTKVNAEANGHEVISVLVSGLDRAHYFSNAAMAFIRVIADKNSRILLGAQGFGCGDVVSSIELLSCAIMKSLTIDEVFDFDVGYAPPFNSPIHFSQTACLVLANKMDGLLATITCKELQDNLSSYTIIDVSPLYDHTTHSIPGSINIPLENLRNSEIQLNSDKPVVLYSKTSSGAYGAYRYLITKGYSELFVLEGGYDFWKC
jgi:rhodanese-related sulfurtransferase